MLYGRFPPKLKEAVYKSYVRPAILHGSVAWCLEESEMGILQSTERSKVRAMCGVQLKDRKRYTDLMFTLGLNETIEQLAMANSVRWDDQVLRREDGHTLRRSLDFEVEGQRRKKRPKRTWKMQFGEENMKVGLKRKDALCRSKWSVGVNKIVGGLR